MKDFVSKETKLHAAKDIVSNYVRNENAKLSADELCEMVKKVYGTIDKMIPEPEPSRVGLA